jgi:hypothetical protein
MSKQTETIQCDACERVCTVSIRSDIKEVIQFCPFCGEYTDLDDATGDDEDDEDETMSGPWHSEWTDDEND